MRVCTPIADLDISIDRLAVENGFLVMTSVASDSVPARAIMGPRDVRNIIGALLRPRIIWFAIACLFRTDEGVREQGSLAEHHPTPNPW